jgi:lipoyl(octanoyl) transferase
LVDCTFIDLEGISYSDAWSRQTDIQQALISAKRSEPTIKMPQTVIFCEHSPVYTLGKSGSLDHLLLSQVELDERGIEYFKINRGGDITYHGPGQITGYPIFDLEYFYTDVHRYVRELEECIIQLLLKYNLHGQRIPGYTGVWLPPIYENGKYRKICAIGVHLSRWVTLHGFAFNVNTDLSYFKNIIPCGIEDEDKEVTSLQQELGYKLDFNEIKLQLKQEMASIFKLNWI